MEYLIKFDYVLVGVSYEAEPSSAVPDNAGTFGYRDPLLFQPKNEFIHAVDDYRPVRISGPLNGLIHQRILAFRVREAVVDKVNSNSGVVDEPYGSVIWSVFVWVDPKPKLRVKGNGSFTIENANPDVVQGSDLEHAGVPVCEVISM
jgi:hypothetical protein